MSAYVQLVDPGGRFVHPQGTLTNDTALRLPLDKRVRAGLQGRILRRVEDPATEAAPAGEADKGATAESDKPEDAAPAATAPKLTVAAKRAAAEAATKANASPPTE